MSSPDPESRLGRPSPLDRDVSVKTLLVGIGALVGVGALVVAAVVVLGGGEADATEVVLESVTAAGDDPFTDSVATTAIGAEGVEAGGVTEVSTNAETPVSAISGETPGLYGGTGDEAACDPVALVGFLDSNPDKGAAFAEAQGIQPDAIGDFVATLTPVVLREDTRVTNHGFSNGRATPLQSVLQAGTAVMVDQRGVPRVRCACGNPLREPEGSTTSLTYAGDPWGGFDENRLVAVEPAAEDLDTLTVSNLETGELEQIDTGSGSTGTPTDADEPLGEVVDYIESPEGFRQGDYVGDCDGASPTTASGTYCSRELLLTEDEAIYAIVDVLLRDSPLFEGGARNTAEEYLRIERPLGGWEITDVFLEPDPSAPVPEWLAPYVG